VRHLLDVVEERARGFHERLEVRALPETLQMSFGGVPLDADDLLPGLVNAAGCLPALAVRLGVEQRPCVPVGLIELVVATGIELVTDVLDNHRSFLLRSLNGDRN
jgi:hypothetical protein